jgi:hypothetical protein
MPPNWWTPKNLVLAAGGLVLAGVLGLALFGLSTPEPVASAALGPDWHCSRLVFIFTTCSRIKHSQSRPARLAKFAVCGRLRI